MKSNPRTLQLALTAAVFTSGVLCAIAADPAPATVLSAGTNPAPAQEQSLQQPDPFKKPEWLTDLSLTVKESYDDNVFLAGAPSQSLPSSYVVPAGSVAAVKNVSSWLTTVSPKVGVDFAPLIGDRKTLQVLSLAYAPDLVMYHDASSESYDAHRFLTAVRANVDDVSLKLDNCFSYIDGSHVAPFYPGDLLNAEGIAAPRERRDQYQDRGALSLQYDQDKWFFRPTASLLYYKLMTDLRDIEGYLNFSSRSDANGGADFGFKINPQFAATLGYRYGEQYQEKFSFSPYSSSSDYQRVLFGVEGKPWSWLDLKVQGGPDFRSYDDTAPVNEKHMTTYYGEAALTATLSDKDALTFKYKQFQWVSSLGKVPYFDSCYDLSYRRKLTDKLDLNLGQRLLGADYTSANLAACHRNDLQATSTAGLNYAFTPHLSAYASYSFDVGATAIENVANPQGRGFYRDLISLGAVLKF